MANSEAGYKAHAKKYAKFGPSEASRARDMQEWTMNNGDSPEKNPYTREKVYPPADQARWKDFDDWEKKNPGRSLLENPHRHPRADKDGRYRRP